jgi:hypothetical protein
MKDSEENPLSPEERQELEQAFGPGAADRIIDAHAVTLQGRAYQCNTVNLYTDGKEICAMIGPDPVQGIAGFGDSVHEALRMLAEELVRNGVWIEVTDDRHPFNWTTTPKIMD